MSTTSIFGHLNFEYIAANPTKGNCWLSSPTTAECQTLPICADWNKTMLCHSLQGHSSCAAGFMFFHPPPFIFPISNRHVEGLALNHSNTYFASHMNTTACVSENPFQCAFEQNLDCQHFVYPFTRACCPGYFCPEGIPCMIPCNMEGAYCPSVPEMDGCVDRDGEHKGCGGSEKVQSCPSGYFCPDASVSVRCPEGYYCPIGATEAIECEVGYQCPPGSTEQESTAFAITLFVMFLVTYLLFYFRLPIQQQVRQCTVGHREETDEIEIDWANESEGDAQRISNFLSKFTLSASTPPVPSHRQSQEETLKESELTKLDFTMSLEFTNLCVRLKENKQKVVNHVTGKFPTGTITAIMGPSGSGKTSLMFGLTGKAKYYAHVTGRVLVNGEENDISKLQKYVGFVPQDDIMNPHLTVREILAHNALLRLPKQTDVAYREKLVDTVIAKLGLWQQRNTVIGDETTRGISGGQKKRVNIAMELVAEPSLLILDEPTSGLDAAMSAIIMRVLHEIAARGTTVVVILHQPRREIFEKFHNVLLLGIGGNLVYHGKQRMILDYFSSIGYKIDRNTNPGDFVIDVIAGFARPENVNENHAKLFREMKEMFHSDSSAWRESEVTYMSDNESRGLVQEEAHEWNVRALHFWWKVKSKHFADIYGRYRGLNPQQFVKRDSPAVFSQFLQMLRRNIIIAVRQYAQYITDVVAIALMSIITAFITSPSKFHKITFNVWIYGLMLGMSSAVASVKLFTDDKQSFYREASAGINKSAYFLSQTFISAIWILLHPTVFLVTLFTMSTPNGSFTDLWVVLVVISSLCQGIGQLMSVWAESSKAYMITAVLVIMLQFTAGLDPPLIVFQSTPAGRFYAAVNPFRYTLEALWIVEMKPLPEVYQIAANGEAQARGWDRSNLSANLNIALGMSAMIRTLILLSMYTADRARKN